MPFPVNVHEIVKNFLHSYETTGGINHLDEVNLPSRESVVGILEDLQNLFFPGFHENVQVDESTLPYGTASRVFRLAKSLITETDKALKFKNRQKNLGQSEDQVYAQAEAFIFSLLQKLPQIRTDLALDVEAALLGDPAAKSTEEVILSYPGIQAITVHRVAHELYTMGVPLIPRMMSEHVHSLTGIDIHPGATIGKRFFIDHGTGVVIGETAVIGENVKIYQGVTLGAHSVKKTEASKKRHPTIEDDVTIYAGATILGGTTVIGRGSVIGGNVFLTKSLAAHSLVSNKPQEPVIKSKDFEALDYSI